MLIRHAVVVTILFAFLLIAPSGRAADLDRALARIVIMTKVRVLLTAELAAQFTAADYLLAAPDTAALRTLRQRTLGSARGKAVMLSRLLTELGRTLDDDVEVQTVTSATRYLAGDNQYAVPVIPDQTDQDAALLIADARGVMVALERAAPALADDPSAAPTLTALVDYQRARAQRSALPDLLGSALTLMRVQVMIAPIFARHSLTRLCRDRLTESRDQESTSHD